MKKKPKKLSVSNFPTYQGIFQRHHKGFGFVTSDTQKLSGDVFIPKHLTKNAMQDDLVEFYVHPKQKSHKGPEGGITKVLKRAQEKITAIIDGREKKDHYLAVSHTIGAKKTIIVHSKAPLHIGDRVILHVEDWGEQNHPILTKLDQVLGHISEPKLDVAICSQEFKIPSKFPKRVLEECKAYGKTVKTGDLKNREDFTHLELFTIDPKTAKDFDDALSLETTPEGDFVLGVHIADVSHYVKKDTFLDEEARARSNSTYFPGSCYPMLPEQLSNELCSLKPRVLRLTVSVIIRLTPAGEVVDYRITKGFIKSQKRFTYEEAKEVIDGTKRSKHKKKLLQMVQLCQILKIQRNKRGSVDLSLPETIIEINDEGEPIGTKVIEYDITHQLVEEFMLKANEIVAEELLKRDQAAIFRIHEPPSRETIEEFGKLARQLGFKVSNELGTDEIVNLFEIAKHTPFAHRMAVAFIRSMKLALYSEENVGHFGLALENYCHFTSPIRRYSDLIVHRALFNEVGEINVKEIAKQCSEKERNSFKAESQVILLKKLRLLEHFYSEDPSRVYTAYITKVSPNGIFFEMQELALPGFIHISMLGNDYFQMHAIKQALLGRHTGKEFSLGDELQILLLSVDMIRLETEWEIFTPQQQKKKKKKNRKRKQ